MIEGHTVLQWEIDDKGDYELGFIPFVIIEVDVWSTILTRS